MGASEYFEPEARAVDAGAVCSLCEGSGWLLEWNKTEGDPRTIHLLPCLIPDCARSGVPANIQVGVSDVHGNRGDLERLARWRSPLAFVTERLGERDVRSVVIPVKSGEREEAGAVR